MAEGLSLQIPHRYACALHTPLPNSLLFGCPLVVAADPAGTALPSAQRRVGQRYNASMCRHLGLKEVQRALISRTRHGALAKGTYSPLTASPDAQELPPTRRNRTSCRVLVHCRQRTGLCVGPLVFSAAFLAAASSAAFLSAASSMAFRAANCCAAASAAACFAAASAAAFSAAVCCAAAAAAAAEASSAAFLAAACFAAASSAAFWAAACCAAASAAAFFAASAFAAASSAAYSVPSSRADQKRHQIRGKELLGAQTKMRVLRLHRLLVCRLLCRWGGVSERGWCAERWGVCVCNQGRVSMPVATSGRTYVFTF